MIATDFRIAQNHDVEQGSECYGKWYVGIGWDGGFLHSDLIIHHYTMHNGEWTGYFDSREAAHATIDAYIAKHKEASQ